MIDPMVRRCDICHEVILPGKRIIKIAAPVSKEERARLMKHIEDNLPKQHGAFLRVMPIAAMVPHAVEIETCDCILSLVPQIVDARVERINRMLSDAEEARKRGDDEDQDELA